MTDTTQPDKKQTEKAKQSDNEHELTLSCMSCHTSNTSATTAFNLCFCLLQL